MNHFLFPLDESRSYFHLSLRDIARAKAVCLEETTENSPDIHIGEH
ncbi:MAG TPA: hypothetical protein VGD14_20750 [bacterium]